MSSSEAVEQMVLQAFPDAPIMVEVARAESQFVETAKNPNSSASGVFQITKDTWAGCEGDIFDAADNIVCARKVYDARGLQPWESSIGDWGG